MNKLLIIASITILLPGCGDGSNTSMRGAEFSSLQNCLSGLKREMGSNLKIITDEQDEVSGIQTDGTFWACNKKTSGTKGIYWEGYYSVKN